MRPDLGARVGRPNHPTGACAAAVAAIAYGGAQRDVHIVAPAAASASSGRPTVCFSRAGPKSSSKAAGCSGATPVSGGRPGFQVGGPEDGVDRLHGGVEVFAIVAESGHALPIFSAAIQHARFLQAVLRTGERLAGCRAASKGAWLPLTRTRVSSWLMRAEQVVIRASATRRARALASGVAIGPQPRRAASRRSHN